jgi:RNA polymerase sigma-70 factor (ECF subfamily)
VWGVVTLGEVDRGAGGCADFAVSDAVVVTGFDAFFEVEFPRLVAFVFVLTGDGGVAEELAQESMLRAFQRWDRVGGYDRPGAWVRRVAANLASSARRRRRAESAALDRLTSTDTTPSVGVDASDERLWGLVRGLPRRQREAVTLFYLEDWSVRDIATVLGCAEATARVHLHRGRQRLAHELGLES